MYFTLELNFLQIHYTKLREARFAKEYIYDLDYTFDQSVLGSITVPLSELMEIHAEGGTRQYPIRNDETINSSDCDKFMNAITCAHKRLVMNDSAIDIHSEVYKGCVSIKFDCHRLIRTDFTSKSDPCIGVLLEDAEGSIN